MKLFFNRITLIFLVALLVTNCGGDQSIPTVEETPKPKPTQPSPQSEPENTAETSAVSTWDKHSLRQEKESNSKWLASLTFGESMELLGETHEGKKRTYEKVRLLDGKEGWVRADLIYQGGKLGVITQTSQVYSRPSISNIGDKEVSSGTLVVVKQRKAEFTEFIAKNDPSNNRVRGWVLGEGAITTDESEVAVAVLLNQAKAEKVLSKRKSKLEAIIHNSSFQNSVFLSEARSILEAAQETDQLREDQLMITGDNVNVRSEPNLDTSEKLFQLHAGDIVEIVTKGKMEEINGNLDYWYEIKGSKGAGWLFGQFTNKSL